MLTDRPRNLYESRPEPMGVEAGLLRESLARLADSRLLKVGSGLTLAGEAPIGPDTSTGRKLAVNEPDRVLLTRAELAERERVPVKSVAEWASKGTGPRYAKIGRYVRYLLTDVEEWEARQFKDPDDNAA